MVSIGESLWQRRGVLRHSRCNVYQTKCFPRFHIKAVNHRTKSIIVFNLWKYTNIIFFPPYPGTLGFDWWPWGVYFFPPAFYSDFLSVFKARRWHATDALSLFAIHIIVPKLQKLKTRYANLKRCNANAVQYLVSPAVDLYWAGSLAIKAMAIKASFSPWSRTISNWISSANPSPGYLPSLVHGDGTQTCDRKLRGTTCAALPTRQGHGNSRPTLPNSGPNSPQERQSTTVWQALSPKSTIIPWHIL